MILDYMFEQTRQKFNKVAFRSNPRTGHTYRQVFLLLWPCPWPDNLDIPFWRCTSIPKWSF